MEKQPQTPETLYAHFQSLSMRELEDMLINAQGRVEKAFYRKLLNFKLQQMQESVVQEDLL